MFKCDCNGCDKVFDRGGLGVEVEFCSNEHFVQWLRDSLAEAEKAEAPTPDRDVEKWCTNGSK